jgi:deoxyribonuclease V
MGAELYLLILAPAGLTRNMIACFDVYYSETTANAAVIMFEDWQSEFSTYQKMIQMSDIEEYKPGNFYKRELPPLLYLIAKLPELPEVLLIDGYCYLSETGEPGLGARLFESLSYNPIIIGIAKNRFRDTHHAKEVYRGNSSRPLFVTSLGISNEEASNRIENMKGKYRIPSMLKAVDTLSRSHCCHRQ